MSTISSIASIGIGATIGATCRYYIGVLSIQYLGKGIPYGTLISNIIGSFIAGILIVLVLEKLYLSETYRLMLLVGLAGSLTTMSALSIESIEMLGGGDYSQALINILLNLGLSLLAASLGVMLAKYGFNLAQG
jgi:CrcB protein|tara:strand:+ start:1182 stop:1583 length:402 start_codon:yes stop_codon:yes gene_type:complete